jgi:hypothetical protein
MEKNNDPLTAHLQNGGLKRYLNVPFSILPLLQVDRLKFQIRQFANLQIVTSNAMTTVQTSNDRQKMKRKANASAKSKEVQPHPQADTQLHHICFCPTAPRAITTFRF